MTSPPTSQFDYDEVEIEEKGRETTLTKPWDPKHIRITTKNFTIREVYSQITEAELDLAPDFQRSYVWKRRQQDRLIESIMLGIPLPAFYFNQDSSGSHQVIDGVQRLTTINLFMSGELILERDNLEYLSPLAGLDYSGLDATTRRRFAATQIVVHIIEPQTPDEVKYDIFNRVNTGGSPLTAQEIRHCMSKQLSRDFLKSLSENDKFDRATDYAFWKKDSSGNAIRDNQRMANREMALRFCAFCDISYGEYSSFASLDAFLLEFTRLLDNRPTVKRRALDLAKLKSKFERAMTNCRDILGNSAFRRWNPNTERRGPINRAIFESHAIALSKYHYHQLKPYKDEIAEAFKQMFDDRLYVSSVTSGTGDVRAVERRLEMPKKILQDIVG
ncbi:DUF262 domain-containing protein [Methylobacterium sp. J-030]|uniref:DUF262 domain-containing protein n=1 Tax=Methylobacterium sp. J-030 TaxID=2836627 RepID=UPI001FB9F34E|nr:DUF262 domain-containing protein [Methylobacterium sp. J-030]MCJ2071101.1 DUF262 domain-containing protein [Methylobacterium sp. J-030]